MSGIRFAILDAHGNPILDWDVAAIAQTAHPRPKLHARRRRKLEKTLTAALELRKLDLFSV